MDNTDKQTITDTASPRPWTAIREIGPDEKLHSVFIADANTIPVARIWPENAADAALIVDAVNQYDEVAMQNTDSNGGRQYASLAQARREERYRKELVKEARELRAERDRLRDIVRRLLPSLRRDIAQCNGPKQAPRLAALLDEARAAIGEDSANG